MQERNAGVGCSRSVLSAEDVETTVSGAADLNEDDVGFFFERLLKRDCCIIGEGLAPLHAPRA